MFRCTVKWTTLWKYCKRRRCLVITNDVLSSFFLGLPRQVPSMVHKWNMYVVLFCCQLPFYCCHSFLHTSSLSHIFLSTSTFHHCQYKRNRCKILGQFSFCCTRFHFRSEKCHQPNEIGDSMAPKRNRKEKLKYKPEIDVNKNGAFCSLSLCLSSSSLCLYATSVSF